MRTKKGFVYKPRRLKDYNYDFPGAYFITVCVNEKEIVFGEIMNGEMKLNEMGLIADKCWKEIPGHFEFVDLGAFVIMPNHVHGIVYIYDDSALAKPLEAFGKLSGNNLKKLPNLIGSYKSSVTKEINRLSLSSVFKWQRSYYDRVIRNEKELENISQYILANPMNWSKDLENEKYLNNITVKERNLKIRDFYHRLSK